MPLIAPAIEAKLKDAIFSNLKEAMSPDISKGDGYESAANPQLEKLATAIAKAVAKVMVDALTNDAMVAPGQQIVGVGGGIPGPVQGATVSPGKIL